MKLYSARKVTYRTNSMTYDEFSDKLRNIKAEFLHNHGRPMETILELDETIAKRLVLRPKKKGLRSLKGIL